MQRVLQARQIEEDEGQLKGPPSGFTLGTWIAASAGVALTSGARDCLIHGAERETRILIGPQKLDACGNSISCLPGRGYQAPRRGLSRRTRDSNNPAIPGRDPSLVVERQMPQGIRQDIWATCRQCRQGFHPKFNIWDLLVWLYALDLGSGKKISKGSANPASLVELPPRRRIASDCKFRDVAIVQVGESCVWILRAIARQVTAWMQADWAMHLKPDLESESNVTKAADRTLAAVHDHNGDGPHMLFAAVGLVERIRTRVSLQNQGATGALLSGGIRHYHWFAATVLRHGQSHSNLAGHSLPLDIPICRVELSLFVDENFLGQWRKGDVIAPTQCHLDLAHGRINHHRQTAGGRCPTLACRRLIIWRVVCGPPATNFRICTFILTKKRITDIFYDVHVLSRSVCRRRKKASKVPAGGVVRQTLIIEVRVRWVRSNKIAPEHIDEPPSD
jgi:hypothetical protein